jgi:hypothetical protein
MDLTARQVVMLIVHQVYAIRTPDTALRTARLVHGGRPAHKVAAKLVFRTDVIEIPAIASLAMTDHTV